MKVPRADRLPLDYEHTMKYLLHLSDTRFKLLGLLPAVTGAAAFGLPLVKELEREPQLGAALSAFGLVVVIGITIYDQRNTMFYDALVRRAKLLEAKLGFSEGGPMRDRPPRWPVPLIGPIWHDLGLAMVYSASIAAWTFLTLRFAAESGFQKIGHVIFQVSGLAFLTSCLILVLLALRNDFMSVARRGAHGWAQKHTRN